MASEIIFHAEGLSKSFGAFRAVEDVSLEIERAEIRAIIGPNGAGKTTFVHVISGLLRPTEGRIELCGTDITKLSAHQRARLGLARTFQITNLFRGLTVEEHVTLAMRGGGLGGRGEEGRSATAVSELLHDVGLESKRDIAVETLSHGDQKVLEVAMALAARPKLLVLDEPTAGMSVSETAAMTKLINDRLRGTVSVIIIEHDMNVVMQTADRITVLANGRKIGEGSPEAIMADKHVREVYLGVTDRS